MYVYTSHVYYQGREAAECGEKKKLAVDGRKRETSLEACSHASNLCCTVMYSSRVPYVPAVPIQELEPYAQRESDSGTEKGKERKGKGKKRKKERKKKKKKGGGYILSAANNGVEYGVWSMEYGVWSVECGAWSVEYRTWSLV